MRVVVASAMTRETLRQASACLGFFAAGCAGDSPPPAVPTPVVAVEAMPSAVAEPAPLPPPLAVVALGDPLTKVRKLALGYGVSCALIDDGTVSCWGRNDHGQRAAQGADPAYKAAPVAGLRDVTDVDVAFFSGCALGPGGTVRCWGEGHSTPEARLVTVPKLSGATQIAVSHYRVLARRKDGSVWCWRPGGCDPRASTFAHQNELLQNVEQVDDHWDHSCARLSDGTVQCWGTVAYESVGAHQASLRSSATPVAVNGLSGVTQVALGASHTCALVGGGSVSCWGLGWHGSLGQGTDASSNVPVAVSGLRDVVQIAAGGTHTCALRQGGTVVCWGRSESGALGDGSNTTRSKPVAVAGLSHVTQIACGGEHSCALIDDGTARCWGSNTYGELGKGELGGTSLVPVTVVRQ